jgi:hypothetical protein
MQGQVPRSWFRGWFFVLAGCLVISAWAQPSKFGQPEDREASGKADQAQGAAILGEFRQAGIAGDYWLSFELRVMPRRGAERSVIGTMVGTRGVNGPVSRIEVGTEQWLIESGPHPAAWALKAGNQVQLLAAGKTGQGIADTGVTVFDLQMPFLYWTDFTYEGEAKVRGRPTHSFILRPPAGSPLPMPGLSGVRVLIDVQFQAMVQAEQLDAKGATVKTISLLDLKKVGEQWLVKTIDVRDNVTRDKTRFSVIAAALDLHWSPATFQPEKLTEDHAVVPKSKIIRF